MSKAQYKKYLPAFFIALCAMPVVNAQYVANYKRAGDQFYAKGDYYSAAQYYEKYLDAKAPGGPSYDPYIIQKQGAGNKPVTGKEKDKQELEYRLAESYRLLKDYTHAMPWYKKLVQSGASAYPLLHYRYAVCLRADGQYKAAQPGLELFLKEYKTKDTWREQAEQELANNIFIQAELSKPTSSVTVSKLNGNINKEGASYAAGWLDGGTLIFTSTRNTAQGKPAYANALYTASLQGGGFGEAAKLPVPALKDKEQGVATVTPDGKKIFFTVWSVDEEGKKKAAIYASDKMGKGWSEPAALDNNINGEGSDTRQPQVTADGKYLLFASNRAGGKGGFDIWYAPLRNGVPGKPMNAGPAINGKGDEEAPFYHAGSHTLVFASNGRTGMGGFDLYTTVGTIGSAWREPQNMGYPVNSVKDDIYFVSRGARLMEDAWLSSDRASACCLELFSVSKTYKQYVAGTVMDCTTHNPLSEVEVVAKDDAGRALAVQTTGADGKYLLEIPAGLSLKIDAGKAKYEQGTLPVAASGGDTVLNQPICLAVLREKKPDIFEGKKTLVTHDIGFAFRKKDITPVSYAYLDEVAAYLKENPTATLEIDAHTDGIGATSFNLKLSQQRAEACVEYLVKAGIARERLIAKGLGECCPLEKEQTAAGKDNPAAREKNRRVELKLVQ